MTVAEVALYAFSFVNAVRVFSYIPQIIKIWRDRSGASGVSYTTWGMFTISHLTTVTYAIYVVDDWKMALVFVGNFASCTLILLLTAWKQGHLSWTRLGQGASWLALAPALRRAAYACSLIALGSFIGVSVAHHSPWIRLPEAHASSAATRPPEGGPASKRGVEFEPVSAEVAPRAEAADAADSAVPAAPAPGASTPVTTAVQPTRTAMPLLVPAQPGLAPTSPAIPLVLPVVTTDVQALLEQAERLLRAGDISGARTIFTSIVSVGDARGAVGMAHSFDPAVLLRTPAAGNGADRSEMAKWQRRAVEMTARRAPALQLR